MVTRGRIRKPGTIEDLSDRRYPLVLPSDYSGLALWYDWSQQPLGQLTSISDLSGNGKTGSVTNGNVSVTSINGMNCGIMSHNNCYIGFSNTNVFTVIRVFRGLGSSGYFLLSSSSNYNFESANGLLVYTTAHANVKGGSWRANGVSKTPTSDIVYTTSNYGKLWIISCILVTSALTQNRIGYDRTYNQQFFVLCEDIIYSTQKTADEVKAIEHSLAHKWGVEDYDFS
jgi:hypothetical protein